MEGDLQRTFGSNMRRVRDRLGLTREELAEQLGYHPTYLGAIERGERNLTLRSVERLCRALGAAPAQMLTAAAA